jgi:tetratricopeptide (TPR) repeat protein
MAGFDMNYACQSAYCTILGLEFKMGEYVLAQEKKEDPGNRVVTLLENYRDMLELVISEDRNRHIDLKKNQAQRLAFIEEDDKETPWFLYSKAEINLQWAFVEVRFGEYKDAAVDISKAWHQLEANQKKFPGFIPDRKCMGLLHALIGSIPDSYQWAADIIGMKGSVKQGVGELKDVLDKTGKGTEFWYLHQEALFYLSFIELNLDNDELEKKKLLDHFSATHYTEPLLVYAAAGMALHSGKNDLVLQFLGDLPRDPDQVRFPFCYLDYLHGVALMNKLDTNAEFYFKKYIGRFRGMNFIRSAFRNMAWCELLKGNENGYERYMAEVNLLGGTRVDEDKQATKEAEGKEAPEVNLLKARLLFDGGYYTQALAAALKMDPGTSSVRELIEFEYRLGRIHHKLNDTEDAIHYYELAVKRGQDYSWYYAANSALQLGLIYEAKGDKAKAKEWFKKCLAMKHDEYRDSIDLKAKAGLSRVE